jgi:hypothetical protein
MALIIDLSPEVEARLELASRSHGTDPATYAKQLVADNLPSTEEARALSVSKPASVHDGHHNGDTAAPLEGTKSTSDGGADKAHALNSLPQDLLLRYHALVQRKHSVGLTFDESVEFERVSEELDTADWNSPAEQQSHAVEEKRHAEQLAILNSIIDQLTILKSI